MVDNQINQWKEQLDQLQNKMKTNINKAFSDFEM